MRCPECGNRLADGLTECPTCHAGTRASGIGCLPAPEVAELAGHDGTGVSVAGNNTRGLAMQSASGAIALSAMDPRAMTAPQSARADKTRAASENGGLHGQVIIAEPAYSERPDRDPCRILTRILWIVLLVCSPLLVLYWLVVKIGGMPALMAFVGLFLLVRLISPINLYAMFRIFNVLNPGTRGTGEQIPVRYFRVREEGTDAEVMVRMKGNLTHGNLGQDDIVTLYGRGKNGVLHATHGHNHRTGSTIKLARSYSWVGLIATLAFIIALAIAFYEPTARIAHTISSMGGQ